MIGKLTSDAGQELDAEASLSRNGTHFELTFESSGESGRRNGDYMRAFELAFKRLAALGATLLDGRVESRTTRDMTPAEKRLVIDHAYPIMLASVGDLASFAQQLRSTGAKVGNHAGRGGNTTKRIALEFSLLDDLGGGVEAAYDRVFKPPARLTSLAATAPEAPLNTWWAATPGERHWLELTGRSDLGADLRAPLLNEQGKRFWSYDLLRHVKRGDIVFHYQREQHAIVAVSRATGTQWPDEIVWAARGTSARNAGLQPRQRPGWYVGLERFEPLSVPITLRQIRAARAHIESELTALKMQTAGSLYFPFELGAREPRPTQGYFFKLPKFFVDLFPGLSVRTWTASGGGPPTFLVPGVYRRADETSSVAASDPFSVDPAIKERALRGHAITQNALADFLKSRGITPRSALGDQPNFDLAWEDGETLWVAEVKSITDDNEEKQLRLGLGQVLRYRQLASQSRKTRAALVAEREPRDKSWPALCASLDVVLAWPGDWKQIAK